MERHTGETQVAGFEIAFFQVLEGPFRIVLGMAGQMDLAVFAGDRASIVDEYGGVEVPPLRCQFGIPEIEPDPEFRRQIEKRPRCRSRHLGFEPAVHLGPVFRVVTREKSGQGQFGKDDDIGVGGGGFPHHLLQAANRDITVVAFLQRP